MPKLLILLVKAGALESSSGLIALANELEDGSLSVLFIYCRYNQVIQRGGARPSCWFHLSATGSDPIGLLKEDLSNGNGGGEL